jgi:hypothetical protein
MRKPPLTIEQILAWADAHHARTGRWPTKQSGSVRGGTDENWNAVHAALYMGRRGQSGGSSLHRLLVKHRGKSVSLRRPAITIEQILAWADAHYQRTGEWPTNRSVRIHGAKDETWHAVEFSLREGCRGLPRGMSLHKLLVKYRGVEPRGARYRKKSASVRRPVLTIEQILAWADVHHERTGRWPTAQSGRVHEAPDETWHRLNAALSSGGRGLPGGSSLRRLLAETREARFHGRPPPLAIPQILAWAEEHRQRTGKWPVVLSGAVHVALGERWENINRALRLGTRGLPGGTSLARLLGKRCPVQKKRNERKTTPLTVAQILAWAKRHRELTGKLPNKHCGAVHGAPTEHWGTLDAHLRQGCRGLPGGCSLAKLLEDHLVKQHRKGRAHRPAP